MATSLVRTRRVAAFLVGLLVAFGAAESGARVVLDTTDAPVLRWHDFSSQLKARQMAAMSEQVDVVIVGTSMAQQDLIPDVMAPHLDGSQVYNAALNGGVPTVMEPWLIDKVLPELNPSMVIWGLSPLDLSAVYGDATKNAYDQAFETKDGLLADTDRLVSRYSKLVSARAVLRDPNSLAGEDLRRGQGQLAEASAALGDSGERIVFGEELGIDRQIEIGQRVSPFNLDRDDLAAIVRTVGILQSRGVEVVFVELPVPARLVSLMPNEGQDQQLFADAVAELGRELAVEVFVASDVYSDDAFVDFTHMSQAAATQFSGDIAGQLAGS